MHRQDLHCMLSLNAKGSIRTALVPLYHVALRALLLAVYCPCAVRAECLISIDRCTMTSETLLAILVIADYVQFCISRNCPTCRCSNTAKLLLSMLTLLFVLLAMQHQHRQRIRGRRLDEGLFKEQKYERKGFHILGVVNRWSFITAPFSP